MNFPYRDQWSIFYYVCVCVCGDVLNVESSYFELRTNNVYVDRRWRTQVCWSCQITDTLTIKADKNRHQDWELVWNNIILYFQQFTKSCREKAFPQPHSGGGGLLQEEPTENAKTSVPVQLHVFTSVSENRGSRADWYRWKFESGCRCWQPDDQCASLWVKGLGGLKHWG